MPLRTINRIGHFTGRRGGARGASRDMQGRANIDACSSGGCVNGRLDACVGGWPVSNTWATGTFSVYMGSLWLYACLFSYLFAAQSKESRRGLLHVGPIELVSSPSVSLNTHTPGTKSAQFFKIKFCTT